MAPGDVRAEVNDPPSWIAGGRLCFRNSTKLHPAKPAFPTSKKCTTTNALTQTTPKQRHKTQPSFQNREALRKDSIDPFKAPLPARDKYRHPPNAHPPTT
jgi:hypothetical protein